MIVEPFPSFINLDELDVIDLLKIVEMLVVVPLLQSFNHFPIIGKWFFSA
ncbi:hypothetical protein [Mammaliicoccus sciuri]|nr:hypothetical protein [Mammaliicoccus sciuri]MCJ1776317.1 hypothetical protein [Mammaliicoccus sciuri]